LDGKEWVVSPGQEQAEQASGMFGPGVKVEVGQDEPQTPDQTTSGAPVHSEAEQTWPDTRGAELVVGQTIVTADTDNQKVGEETPQVDLPSEQEMIDRFSQMTYEQKLQVAKDSLIGMIADENLSREDRDFYEALLKQGDVAVLAYANGEMDRRSADIRQGTALVPFVAQELQTLVDQGVIDQTQATMVQDKAVAAITDGKGPRNKEGIKSFLIQGAFGMAFDKITNFDLGVDSLFNAICSALACK